MSQPYDPGQSPYGQPNHPQSPFPGSGHPPSGGYGQPAYPGYPPPPPRARTAPGCGGGARS